MCIHYRCASLRLKTEFRLRSIHRLRPTVECSCSSQFSSCCRKTYYARRKTRDVMNAWWVSWRKEMKRMLLSDVVQLTWIWGRRKWRGNFLQCLQLLLHCKATWEERPRWGFCHTRRNNSWCRYRTNLLSMSWVPCNCCQLLMYFHWQTRDFPSQKLEVNPKVFKIRNCAAKFNPLFSCTSKNNHFSLHLHVSRLTCGPQLNRLQNEKCMYEIGKWEKSEREREKILRERKVLIRNWKAWAELLKWESFEWESNDEFGIFSN